MVFVLQTQAIALWKYENITHKFRTQGSTQCRGSEKGHKNGTKSMQTQKGRCTKTFSTFWVSLTHSFCVFFVRHILVWICTCSYPLRISPRIAARVLMATKYVRKICKRRIFFFKYFIQHCFVRRPSDSTVSEDAGIEARTVTNFVLAVRGLTTTRLQRSHQIWHLCSSPFFT